MLSSLKNQYILNLILGLLVVGIVAAIVLKVQTLFFQQQEQPVVDTKTQDLERVTIPTEEEDSDIPPFTEKIKKQLEASPGFSALISYTDRGFEPTTLTVSQGETIRFTNNSGRDLWVSVDGDQSCDESTMNSCEVIAPLEFWEYTFTTSGTFEYKNREFPSNVGTITVEAL